METNMNTDTNDCPRWRLCEDAVDAIEFALAVNAENGVKVGFRLVREARGAMLEADSPHDALDASDYIEREAELEGAVHTKSVLILSGFLFDTFGKDKPLSLSIRLVFEQSYSGVDGDSASSAELYAVLSGLSGLPIRQEIAVTGSVNQNGEIQAVGGINEKIEGYFEINIALIS